MNDGPTVVSRPLVGGGAIVAALLAVVLWCSNPDEATFRRWLVRADVAEQEEGMEQLLGQILKPAVVALLDVQLVNYGFFSTATVHWAGDSVSFVGILGQWIVLN